jgi:hypothetical protein
MTKKDLITEIKKNDKISKPEKAEDLVNHYRGKPLKLFSVLKLCLYSFESQKNFHLDLKQIYLLTKDIPGIGEITKYDIAQLLSPHEPAGIYLHGGTLIGLKNFFKYFKKEFPKKSVIMKSDLPYTEIFGEISPSVLEDLFCQHKNNIPRLLNYVTKNRLKVKSCSYRLRNKTIRVCEAKKIDNRKKKKNCRKIFGN